MNEFADAHAEFWMAVEEQAAVLKMWMTGEPAKTLVLERLVERIDAVEDIAPSTPGYMEELVTGCCQEAVEKIEAGEFSQPTYWLMEICDLLNLARCWDGQRVLQTPQKRRILHAQLRAIVERLKGCRGSVLESTLRAVQEELRKI